MIHTYKDLTVWKKAMDLAEKIYILTETFPKSELYGIVSQMRRSAISMPSNIAEGRYRSTRKDYLYFLRVAYGSGAELETQLELSKRLSYTKEINARPVAELMDEVMKMLNIMIRTMERPISTPKSW